MIEYIKDEIQKSIDIKTKFLNDTPNIEALERVARASIQAYKEGRKILVAGNGGSAADAQHIAGELVSKFYFDRPALSAIALTTDTSILTAIGNDYGYEKLFSRQIEANAQKGDIFIAISTSGNSQNILEALKVAKERGIQTVGLTGESGGKMREMCDECLCAPSPETPRIQEVHIVIGHLLCAIIEKEIFKER